MEATVPDNTQLVELTHDSVMSNLRRRHVGKDIYTFTGSILLAMNPYAHLPIYDHKSMKSYLERSVRKAKPHVFASAEEAFLSLRKQRRSQSLVTRIGNPAHPLCLLTYLIVRTYLPYTTQNSVLVPNRPD